MKLFLTRPDFYFSTARWVRIALSRSTLPGAPAALRGRTALFVTDVHMRPNVSPARLRRLIDESAADLILFGGDFADTQDQTLRLLDALRGISAPLGIFAVRGNNDSEAFPDADVLRTAMEDIGCRLLINESVPVLNGTLRVGGLDEHKYGHPDYARVFPQDQSAKLLLSHFPILPQAAPQEMPRWMLCGHTHGGQFNFLGLNPFSIGFEQVGSHQGLAPERVLGEADVRGVHLLVSRGVGCSRIPLRIGVRPEIHLLTFQ